jgi:hypothetical protein
MAVQRVRVIPVDACPNTREDRDLPLKTTVAKRKTRSLPRLRKERRLGRAPERRINVTRGEYNRVIDILNERTTILNEFRDAIDRLRRENATQLHRTAEIQVELDEIKRAWLRRKSSA